MPQNNMTKKDQKDYISLAIYILSLTATRDSESTSEMDKTVLSHIRSLIRYQMLLDNLNPNMVILQTVGFSEQAGLEYIQEMIDQNLIPDITKED